MQYVLDVKNIVQSCYWLELKLCYTSCLHRFQHNFSNLGTPRIKPVLKNMFINIINSHLYAVLNKCY